MSVEPKPRGNVVNYFEGNGDRDRTLSKESGYWTSLGLTNDGAPNIYITVNGMRMKVEADEVFDEDFVDFNSVVIEALGNYRIWLRE